MVEYNARFGDPETQPLLSMLDTDLMDIFQACVDGTLDQVDIQWKRGRGLLHRAGLRGATR